MGQGIPAAMVSWDRMPSLSVSIMKTNPSNSPDRRQFLKTGAAAGALMMLPARALQVQAAAPARQLKVAFAGMGGQIQGHVSGILQLGHQVVAMCDVDSAQIAKTKARHGEAVAKAAVYKDYRLMLEKEPSIEAVVIATPDHWHAPICRAAMEAGKHVYCEKPLTHTIYEARQLRELCRASKVVTQMGNQGSASDNLRRSMELIAAGFFGEIREVHAWHPVHGWPSGVDRPLDSDPVPEGLDWDFWLGTSPARPYKTKIYHPNDWRGWYDFGNGSLGDFCCHSFNLPLRALKLDYPDKIEIEGTGLGKESFAESCSVKLHFPAREGRGPVVLNWHTGGKLPPESATEWLRGPGGKLPGNGCLLIGDKGQLQCGLWNSDCNIRMKDDPRFIWAGNHPAAKLIPQSIPRVKGQLQEWVDACLGGPRVFSDFDFGGHLTEIGLAGIVALRLQKNIPWDGPGMKVPGMPEADALIKRGDRTAYLPGH